MTMIGPRRYCPQCGERLRQTVREHNLFRRARQYVAAGRLPDTAPASCSAGSGNAQACSLCGLTIRPDHIELSSTAGGVTFRFHAACHAIWQLAANGGNPRRAPAL